jgi:hypothetical protein
MREIATKCETLGWDFVIAGDTKSPKDFALDGAVYLDIEGQRTMGKYGLLCPERSYTRKNLAYLYAIRAKAPFILETDDDNMPLAAFWQYPSATVTGRRAGLSGWTNAYRYFSDDFIYPRGFPIDQARADWARGPQTLDQDTSTCPIQQGLADENPDVDAIYRMLFPLPFTFKPGAPVILAERAWCPFNSQNTVFFSDAFPLLYLPATCTFRMTDIWRGLIAQRILWTCGWNVSFHQASVVQDRNEHNLLKDFEDEIPGYLGNRDIVDLLQVLDLTLGKDHLATNLQTCYKALISHGFFLPKEAMLLDAWLEDLAECIA